MATGAAPTATLSDLQDWLIKIADHTRMTREAVERRDESARREQSGSPPWVDAFARRLEATLGAATVSALSRVQGLASRGLAGTVDQTAKDYAFDQLGRQLAAVFQPVTQAMTYFATQLARGMSSWSGDDQNRMLAIGIGARVGYGLGGARGAMGGAALGYGAGDSGPSAPYAGAVGGAIAGAPGGVYGAAAGALIGWGAARGDFGAMKRRGDGDAVSAAGTALTTLGDFADYAAGYNPLTAAPYWGLRSMGLSSYGDMARWTMGIPGRDGGVLSGPEGPGSGGWMARRAAAATAAPRRDVTPFDAQMVDVGATAMKIQEQVIKATAGAGDDGGPLKFFADKMLEIIRLLSILAGVPSAAPAPAAAGAAPR
jgi:hypothetical protein